MPAKVRKKIGLTKHQPDFFFPLSVLVGLVVATATAARISDGSMLVFSQASSHTSMIAQNPPIFYNILIQPSNAPNPADKKNREPEGSLFVTCHDVTLSR